MENGRIEPRLSAVRGSYSPGIFTSSLLPLFEPHLKTHWAPHSSSFFCPYRPRSPSCFSDIRGRSLKSWLKSSVVQLVVIQSSISLFQGDDVVAVAQYQYVRKACGRTVFFSFDQEQSVVGIVYNIQIMRWLFIWRVSGPIYVLLDTNKTCLSSPSTSFVFNIWRATCALIGRQAHEADTCRVLQDEIVTFGPVCIDLSNKKIELSKKTCQIVRNIFV